MGYDLERMVLKTFFDEVCTLGPLDNSISDSKLVRMTQSKLKAALRDVERKCTCDKLKYCWPCTLCQGSVKEVVFLRRVFRQLRKAKKHGMTPEDIQSIVHQTKKDIGVGG